MHFNSASLKLCPYCTMYNFVHTCTIVHVNEGVSKQRLTIHAYTCQDWCQPRSCMLNKYITNCNSCFIKCCSRSFTCPALFRTDDFLSMVSNLLDNFRLPFEFAEICISASKMRRGTLETRVSVGRVQRWRLINTLVSYNNAS
jgi:hypothetical protein